MIETTNFITTGDLENWFTSSIYLDNQEKIDFCCNSAYKLVENYCSRNFKQMTYTEQYKSQGNSEVILKNYPFITLNEFKIFQNDNDSLIADIIAENIEYFIDNDVGIISLSTYFIRPNAIIKISYDAGYPFDSIPFDLRMATLLQTQYFLKSFGGESGSKLGLKSFSKMNENVTKDDNLSNYGLVSEVVGLLESYKRMEAPLIQSYRGTV